jgi:adenylate kinase
MVLDLVIDPDVLLKRITGRRSCSTCGSVFHEESNPPLNEGKCDECDSTLVQRRDDTEEIFKERLKVYHEQTEQLIKYYKDMDLLTDIDGSGIIDDIQENIENKIKEKVLD